MGCPGRMSDRLRTLGTMAAWTRTRGSMRTRQSRPCVHAVTADHHRRARCQVARAGREGLCTHSLCAHAARINTDLGFCPSFLDTSHPPRGRRRRSAARARLPIAEPSRREPSTVPDCVDRSPVQVRYCAPMMRRIVATLNPGSRRPPRQHQPARGSLLAFRESAYFYRHRVPFGGRLATCTRSAW